MCASRPSRAERNDQHVFCVEDRFIRVPSYAAPRHAARHSHRAHADAIHTGARSPSPSPVVSTVPPLPKGAVARARRRIARVLHLSASALRVFFTEGPREFWWRLSDWRAARTTLPARDPLEFEGDWVFAGRSARIHPGVPVDPARPEVSVVVVAWNALEELKACLTSVVRAGGRRTFEVVVVDNGSRADVLDWLCEWADQGVAVRVVRLDENTGFAHGTNVGAAVSRGRFLALLNSDTVVTDDWLDRLVDILESDT